VTVHLEVGLALRARDLIDDFMSSGEPLRVRRPKPAFQLGADEEMSVGITRSTFVHTGQT
jgi:hypothetical protein